MKFDITKIANVILYMIDNKVENLNDKKLVALLFLIDDAHLKNCGQKIFGEVYKKQKRVPEAKILSDIFDIIANDKDLEEDDARLYIITELLDFLDIEILEKSKYNELKFVKMEEDFDDNLFSKDEMKTIDKIIKKYKDYTSRNVANATFQNEKVRTTAIGEIII